MVTRAVWPGGAGRVAALVAVGVYVIAEQVRYHYLPDHRLARRSELGQRPGLARPRPARRRTSWSADAIPLRAGVYAPGPQRSAGKGPLVITTGSAAGGEQVSLGSSSPSAPVALYDLGYVLEKQALADLPPRLDRRPRCSSAVARSPRWIAGFAPCSSGSVFRLWP